MEGKTDGKDHVGQRKLGTDFNELDIRTEEYHRQLSENRGITVCVDSELEEEGK